MKDTSFIILAAGIGTRMKSELPKALHKLLGAPLISYPLRTVIELKPSKIIVVIGYKGDLVKKIIQDMFKNIHILFSFQENPLGTAHAVLCAEKETIETKNVLILNGDLPLLKPSTIHELKKTFVSSGKTISLISAVFENPYGYGRLIKENDRKILRIVEEKDATEEEKKIKEVYTGVMMVNREFLFTNLKEIQRNNKGGEYYLTDLIEITVKKGKSVGAYLLADPGEAFQVNNRVELFAAQKILQEKKNKELMLGGVGIADPLRVYIENDCSIGKDTIIYPEVYIKKGSQIGQRCEIGPSVVIEGAKIEDDVKIKPFSVITESTINNNVQIGPFAHLRPQCTIGEKAKIGNFVELKKTIIGEGSKANHLSYLGDSIIGKNVNVGAGTITCNYDGYKKYETIIEDEVFIGSDTQLVAPVKVKKGAYIASGTTVTEEVPEGSLAISRVPQKNVAGYVEKKKKKMMENS